MNLATESFLWGIVSAVSLPLGAMLGLAWRPKRRVNSVFMAFGAGALIFALTIELFGHVPHHVQEHGLGALIAAIVGALAGGLLFDGLNQLLNNYGAFLRRLGNAKKYVTRLKIKRTRRLVKELKLIRVLSQMTPKQLARLVQRVHRERFPPGSIIFRQGELADDLYFIVSGQVEIIVHDRHDRGAGERIAVLGEGETFGELGILGDEPRSADARALSDVRVYRIAKHDFDEIIPIAPEFDTALKALAKTRVVLPSVPETQDRDSNWEQQAIRYIEDSTPSVSIDEIKDEGREKAKTAGGAAMAIWLGILIDGVPESLVIGMLATSAAGMSLAFIAGVFIANFPEAMSSAVSMKEHGMGKLKIFVMWSSICLITGIGAVIGAISFPGEPSGTTFYVVIGIEGLAAGAMLTMIAETMLPEAFEQGGAIVGISTLCGFLTALVVKVI